MKLDMNQAWQQGISLVGANWQLLLVLAGIFLFLPSVAITVMMPDIFSGLGGMTEPEEVNAWMMDNWPQFAGATAVATFFQFIGYMANQLRRICASQHGRITGHQHGISTKRLHIQGELGECFRYFQDGGCFFPGHLDRFRDQQGLFLQHSLVDPAAKLLVEDSFVECMLIDN